MASPLDENIPHSSPTKSLKSKSPKLSAFSIIEDRLLINPHNTYDCVNDVMFPTETSLTAPQSHMMISKCPSSNEELDRLSRLHRFSNVYDHQDIYESLLRAPTFLGIPVEIRNIIYEFLLVNSDTCKPTFSQDPGWSDPMTLGLSPEILRASRQIHNEALDVLYGKNTFLYTSVMSEVGDWRPLGGRLSPLLRHVSSLNPDEIWNHIETISRVRKWKVILTSNNQAGDCPAPIFIEFCRALSMFSPSYLSLEIVVIPRGMDSRSDGYHEMSDILQPLRYLRGMENILFRDPTAHELPQPIEASGAIFPLRWNMNQHLDLTEELTSIVTSNEAVELTFKLYLSLKNYAQAFERYLPFKDDMDLSKGMKIATKGLDVDAFYENIIPNPLKGDKIHPVESALMYAKECSYRDALEIFKKFRGYALEYLESQWEELDLAATSMNFFIKEEKRKRGILDVEDIFGDHIPQESLKKRRDEALFLIECYAAALERGMPRDIKKQFCAQQCRIDAIYRSMDRHFNLSRLRSIYEIRDFINWRQWFQIAVDELDKQYFEIRAARQKLFDWDISNEPRCDIKIIKTLDHDERINWEVNEPDIGCSELETRSIDPGDDDDYDSNDGFTPIQGYGGLYDYDDDEGVSLEWQEDDDNVKDNRNYDAEEGLGDDTMLEVGGGATRELPVFYAEDGVEGEEERIAEDDEYAEFLEDDGDLYD